MNARYLPDNYNVLKKRNIRNTEKRSYNCGGYALESFSWYLPRHGDIPIGWDYGSTVENCVKAMMEDFPNLRVIASVDDLRENEYAVAFRLSEHDFHYVKRAANGHWFHKRGASCYIDTMKKEVVFSESWGNGYKGEIALLAVARQSLTTFILLDVARLTKVY